MVSRNSSFAHRSNAGDVTQTSRELAVRYLLEGSVRLAEGRVRITGQLIDATTGVHLWARRYDRNWADVLAVHDEIAQAIAAALAPAIIHAERQRAARKMPEDLGAWEAYQRGMWHMSKCDAAENQLARSFFQRAIDRDPNYAPGYGALAWSHMMSAPIFSEMTVAEGCSLGEPLVRKAIALDENDTEARARLALAALLKATSKEPSRRPAGSCGRRKCADALGVKGAALVYSGRRAEGPYGPPAVSQIEPSRSGRPIRLTQIAVSLYLDGGYERPR